MRHNVFIVCVFSIRARIACLLSGLLHIMSMHIVSEVRSVCSMYGHCHLLSNFYIQSFVNNVFIVKVEAILLEKCVLLTVRCLQEISKQNPIVRIFTEN